MKHTPVLLKAVLDALGEIGGRTIIDCTFGAGGYSRAFLERGAKVIAFDRDPSVVPIAEEFLREFGDRFQFINAPFSEINTIHDSRFTIHAIVFDFGVSSMQIDTPERGFSWRFDAPLDMRMEGGAVAPPASELIETSSLEELTRVLRDYGDLRNARAIAAALKKNLPKTTFQLRDLIHNPKDIAPVFQALRIAVNDELGEIEAALAAVPDLLAPGGLPPEALAKGGICAAVSFHSLEDRLIKSTFREWTEVKGDARLPNVGANENSPKFQLLKTVRPDAAELVENPRSRSAHLRAVRKISD